MAPWRKSATPHPSPSPFQSQSDNAAKSSSSEVQINTTIEEHSPRATRSHTLRAILHNTPSQSEEEGSSSERGEESGSKSGSGSRGSAESPSGSQENATTPPPAVGSEAETGAYEEACAEEDGDDVTKNDTMAQYIHLHEFDPAARQQLIDYICCI